MRYRDSGVDIQRAEGVKEAIGRVVRGTWGTAVRPLPGGFAGVMAWPGTGDVPLLAATMDGVGTKLHLALEAGRVEQAAADLVYHCANDLLAHGARPLAFLDYVAQSQLDPTQVERAILGLARACSEVGAALLGGETAEMPDTYLPGVMDVAGCLLGSVPPGGLLGVAEARPGDVLLGLGSNGLHTNGYSLARRILAASGKTLADPLPGGRGESIGEGLLASHRWYGPALTPQLERGRVRALAHVTGGGIAGNLVRVLPDGTRARVESASWEWPPVFRWLVEAGQVPLEDARATFNLGIGMVVVCSPAEEELLAADLGRAGESVTRIGVVVSGVRGVEWGSDS
jgi:phosphoribosylformylglycinamidine cyclo-ligase